MKVGDLVNLWIDRSPSMQGWIDFENALTCDGIVSNMPYEQRKAHKEAIIKEIPPEWHEWGTWLVSAKRQACDPNTLQPYDYDEYHLIIVGEHPYSDIRCMTLSENETTYKWELISKGAIE